MRNAHKFRVGASLIALMAAGQLYAATYSNFVVGGNNRIEDSVVLGIAGLSVGNSYSDAEINAAVQRLYASGLFAEVDAVPSGRTIVFNVSENPTINRIFFEGNDKEKDATLRALVQAAPRQGLDRAKLEEDAANIRRYYASKSRFDTEVRPVVIAAGDGIYNVVFEVTEGDTANINRLTFSGNEQVSDFRLRRVVDSGESGLLTGLFSGDNFSTDKLSSDQQKLLDYYRENGFYRAELRTVTADYDALGKFFVSYDIVEGQKYRFGAIDIASEVAGVEGTRFARDIAMKTGRTYQLSKVRETIEAIEDSAARYGYPFLRVVPEVNARESTGEIDITLRLVQSDRNYVERIDIHGNSSTLDRVIRRQFEIVEGDPLNERKIAEAQDRLRAMGIFGRVVVSQREGSTPGQKVVDVEIEEIPTGSLIFGASYSDSDGFGGQASYREDNFLGRGQTTDLSLSYGRDTQSASFSFTEPGLFERNVAGGFSLSYRLSERPESVYSSTRFSFEPFVRFPLTENSSLRLSYFWRSTHIRDVNEATSPIIRADEGWHETSGISAAWSWNRVNSNARPTKGWVARLGGEYAGIGTGDEWIKYTASGKLFYPVFGDDVVFSLEAEGGAIQSLNDKPINTIERFTLGGRSFNGFENGGIGPRDLTDTVDSSLGGNNYVYTKAEVQFPLGLPDELGISGAAFWQGGSVWGLDNTAGASGVIDDAFYFRQNVGVALLWNLGGATLRFSYTDPIEKQPLDRDDSFGIYLSAAF